MANLSEVKRKKMLSFLETLRREHSDDDFIRAFAEIENMLNEKKYGLVWEKHEENVDLMIEKYIPVFKEEEEKYINCGELTNNFLIEGDNLQSLYLLEKTHKNRIDIIYIDPPYNTEKSGFTYDDKMVDTNDSYRHSKWLSFMERRLKIARELLAEKGVIFISIDNSELYNLKLLCDSIFLESNFIGNIVWRTTTDNNVSQITTEHEYILAYAYDKNKLDKWTAKSPEADVIKQYYEKLRKKYKNDNETIQLELRKWLGENEEKFQGLMHYDNVDDKGVFHDGDIANTVMGGYKYEVIHPVTGKKCKIPEKGFRFAKETMDIMIENDDIMFGEDETTLIKPKKRLEDKKSTLKAYYYEDNRAATKKLEKIFNEKSRFSNPKSTKLLKMLFSFAGDKDAIILDFFAGSGSTGEAVIELNNEDGGNRTFILCTNNEVSPINTIRYLHDNGEMTDYNPGERTKGTTIDNKIKKYFKDNEDRYNELFVKEDGKEKMSEYGICKFVTYPRLKTIITGRRYKDDSIYSDTKNKVNLKYFKCEWTPRKPEDYLLSNALCLHVKEMIELQTGISIDNRKQVLILNKTDFKKYILNGDVSEIESVWINQNILFNSEEIKVLNKIGFKYIPKEFFGFELKEAAE